MNQGVPDRSTFEAIEAYVLDRMTAEERSAFEHRLASDALLRKELELEREHIRAIELGGLARLLERISSEEQAAEPDGAGWGRFLKYAAMIALVAGAVVWWSTRAPLNERLYAEHFIPDPGLPVTMGAAQDPAFADAMIAYKLGDHAEARVKWTALLEREPANDTLRYYIASAWMAEGGIDQAIPLYRALVRESGSVFHDRARWFLFLCHVRTGELAEARSLGMEEDPVYGERARAVTTALAP